HNDAGAVAVFEQLLDKEGLVRRDQMCEAFARIAARNKTYLANALGSLGKVLARLGAGQEQSPVYKQYRALIEQTVPALPEQPQDWEKVLTGLEKAAPNDWALACKAECLIEAGRPTISAEQLGKARQAAFAAHPAGRASGYIHYVRALVLDASNNPADQMDAA